MGAILFVSGTDTNVGKTWITAAIARHWKNQKRAILAVKPVETGCSRDGEGALFAADATRLAVAIHAHDEQSTILRKFEPPLSPWAAAEIAGQTINVSDIVRKLRELSTHCDLLMVEGAGGLLVPWSERYLTADIVRELDAGLLIVARNSLGTVNHTLLTLREAARNQLRVLGTILTSTSSQLAPDGESNSRHIAKLSNRPIWGPIPHEPSDDLEVAAMQVAKWVPLDALFQNALAQST